MTATFDVMILGAGMAGASLAAELASHRRVVLLEIEDQPGRHATGRSAAMFFESYGNPTVRALTRASRAFLASPPDGFTQTPLMTPRDALFVADEARRSNLETLLSDIPALKPVQSPRAKELCPILRNDWLAAAAIDSTGQDIDVAALHQGYLKLAKARGTTFAFDSGETQIERADGRWQVTARTGIYRAETLVNASGAWGDQVAMLAGVAPIGLQPMRRTAITLDAPSGHDIRAWPLVMDVDEAFYFKPDAGQLLLSPANEDPSEPCDAAPDELDIAIAVDRFETATTVSVRKIGHRWAGLRTFVPDRSPVAGFDPTNDQFFWLVGQGGYGIQLAPALARMAASLLLRQAPPDDILAQGVAAADISPNRASLRNGSGL